MTKNISTGASLVGSMLAMLMVAGAASASQANTNELPALKSLPPSTDQSALGRRGFLYVGGEYVGSGATRTMDGQAYVEFLVPKRPTQPYPIILIHGGAQTSTNFLQTPDGKPGWADYFVQHGYVVYMVDQPTRGRSPYHARYDGEMFSITPQSAEQSFVAPERYRKFPQAVHHTQWPADQVANMGEGNPTFDAMYATQVESLKSESLAERLGQRAVDALLDRIGPAIVLTHSQSGPVGWAIADLRPKLVKAIIAVEPSGPPFENLGTATTTANKGRVYGVTDMPMTYDPPIHDASELVPAREAQADGPDLLTCTLQAAPARRLINLQNIPVLMISAEASYHSPYDHCTAKYLKQAGVPVQFVHLADVGIRGNSHVMMLEKNNQQIAAFIDGWIRKDVSLRH